MGDVVLSNAAEDEGFDLNDRMAISKYLRAQVNILPELPCISMILILLNTGQ